MRVPLTVNDFLERAELVYGDRVGVIDEPDQPAASWGSSTWREIARRARAQAAGLDALGLGVGERVAIVSQNSARLFTSFFGVSGSGRVLVPINFRLNADEVAYIVEHCGASMLLIDPELEESLRSIDAKHRFVLGDEADELLYRYDTEPKPWRDPRAWSDASGRGRRAAADAHDRAGRVGARLGVQSDLRPHRDVAAAHDQPPARRVRRAHAK